MNRKVMKTMIAILVTITVMGVGALLYVLDVFGEQKTSGEPTLDEMIENSYQTSEITGDLKDGSFVRLQFKIVTDSRKAKEEAEKREFQLKNILIKELVKLNEEDFNRSLTDLEQMLATKMNGLMKNGNIVDVYTIDKILQ
ncbi:flagellar basal body-associated protein FliL [Aquibacillus sp. 3ASR75-11]|uniref:Flagellar basal body-associated protein FliL n=1 Tax=Terrihalobacillus insolitus TaxID=2950438 RepID=A0A9X3WQU2_9BACI|nr:flagellar basal body-associated protein FliL [Terrihalobacillus insolitus]MDC3414129.1 flagellar basal body-associated protein FliL [Terrihalobacillus insolitus]MDC3423570.1 flagellar basal body-associated protein FliL [Terrihalobacillus insolitus]